MMASVCIMLYCIMPSCCSMMLYHGKAYINMSISCSGLKGCEFIPTLLFYAHEHQRVKRHFAVNTRNDV